MLWRKPPEDIAKVGVEGSNPFARSRFRRKIKALRRPPVRRHKVSTKLDTTNIGLGDGLWLSRQLALDERSSAPRLHRKHASQQLRIG